MPIQLSLVIPCLDEKDAKLQQLLRSIESDDFPKNEMEVLIITEGTSESAKAIGIRRSVGDVIGFLASDNEILEPLFLRTMYLAASRKGACQTARYSYIKGDDILNRYFSLIGGNDPLSYYMGKNDKWPYFKEIDKEYISGKTTGDNGFFVRADLIKTTDLENYYHIDNSNEIGPIINVVPYFIWHKTGGNLFKFFQKRYRYGLHHAFNKNRRWHLVDFRQPSDIWRLLCFIFVTLTVVQPLYLSIRGFLKIRDVAWFMHYPVCVMTVFTYGLLIIHLFLRQLSQSLFAPWTARRA